MADVGPRTADPGAGRGNVFVLDRGDGGRVGVSRRDALIRARVLLQRAHARAREAAGDKDVSLMGGADVIRQALRGGQVDELFITIAPVVLGGGKRLFEGFDETFRLEHLGVVQSPFATHIQYRVLR